MKYYATLNFEGISGYPNLIPIEIRKHLPIFSGKKSELACQHVKRVSDLIGEFEICQEDICMKLFVQSLKEDARDWFSFLPVNSITSWEELISDFMDQFDEKMSDYDMMKEFIYIQIKEDELVPTFNIKFSQTLSKISRKYKFDDKVCLDIYMSAFGKKMGFLLRNKEPKTLYEAFNTTRDIENNLKFGIAKRFVSAVVSCQNTFNGEIPCEAEPIIPCLGASSFAIPNDFVDAYDSNLDESQEPLLSMPVGSHSNDGMISVQCCDNVDIEIDIYKGYVPFDLYVGYVDYVTANYQVNHVSPKVKNNENYGNDDHQSLHVVDVLDVEMPSTDGSPNVADYASENVQ